MITVYISDESLATVQNEEVPWSGRHLLEWCAVLKEAATYKDVFYPNAIPMGIESKYLSELARQASHLKTNQRTTNVLAHVMHAIKLGSTTATVVHVLTDDERLEAARSREPKTSYGIEVSERRAAARTAEALLQEEEE